jgi:hypothetical protein
MRFRREAKHQLELNPFESPGADSETSDCLSKKSSVRKGIALAAFAMPFLLAYPLHYWVMNHAGSWFVTTRLEPEHREGHLRLMYQPLIASVAVPFFFTGAIMLWKDRCFPRLTGLLALLFGVLLIPALIWIGIGVYCFFEYG